MRTIFLAGLSRALQLAVGAAVAATLAGILWGGCASMSPSTKCILQRSAVRCGGQAALCVKQVVSECKAQNAAPESAAACAAR